MTLLDTSTNDYSSAPTGEVVLMRHPTHMQRKSPEWQALCKAIEQAGAQVIQLPFQKDAAHHRDAMFVRDPTVAVAGRFFVGKNMPECVEKELEALYDAGLPLESIEGRIEGGNAVYDPHRRQLFVGINHAGANDLRDDRLSIGRGGNNCDDASIRKMAQQGWEKRRLRDGKQFANALAALESRGIPVRPLFMPEGSTSDFYHLDGALGILPSGQAVIHKEAFSHTAHQVLDRALGKDTSRFYINRREAIRGAANFITVGNRIITPYASPKMKETFRGWGYETIDPQAVGQPEGVWMFAPMGGVRCATLKSTEDMGFPETSQTIQKSR